MAKDQGGPTAQRTDQGDLVAKKLRTGEIAVWDGDERAVILLGAAGSGPDRVRARVISGSTLRALEEALGDVIVLV